ncbi:MAG: hypothetical protein ACRD1L_12800, partial [Terriglobales bacterium]
MTCPRCRRPTAACRCQAELLPPQPAWRHELQERVDQYRARRRRLRPSAAAPALGPAPSDRRVLRFRARPGEAAAALASA